MRLAPFALLPLFALPACQPYGYGYADSYGGSYYGAPAYETPVYADPYAGGGYVEPAGGGVLLFGGERRDDRYRDRYRGYGEGRRFDDRRNNRNESRNDFRRDDSRGRGEQFARPSAPVGLPPPQRAASPQQFNPPPPLARTPAEASTPEYRARVNAAPSVLDTGGSNR